MSDLHAQLTAKRHRLQAQIELIDEVLSQSQSAETAHTTTVAAVATAAVSASAPPTQKPVAEAPPRPKAPSPKPAGGNHRVLTFQEVAQHLADGPKGIGYLRDKLRSDPKTIKKCLEKHNLLFRKAYPLDRLSPWELTDEGRKELAG